MSAFDHAVNPAVLNGVAALEAAGLIAQDARATGAGYDLVNAWHPLTLSDMLADVEPLREVVEGFVKPGLVAVFGAPGSLKSMLLADLAVCAALGKGWLEPMRGELVEAKPTTATAAVWLDTDNGRRATANRLGAIARAHGVTDPNAALPVYPFALPSPAFVASDARAVEAMRDLLRHYSAGLLVIDNLGNIAGGADENSADMVQVMANLRWLAEDADCCIVLIHHQRKANGTKTRAGETLRGHSSIEAALDLALLVERDETQTDTVNVKATKCRHAQVDPFAARFTYQHKEGTRDFELARFFGCARTPEEGDREARQIDEAILGAAKGQSLRQLVEAVKGATGAGEKRIRDRIYILVQGGRLRREQGKRADSYYVK